MRLPKRFSVMTLNIWGSKHLERRGPCLTEFFQRFDPDLLGLQEASAEAQAVVKAALVNHACVDLDHSGWSTQGNLFWRTTAFGLVEYGAEELENVHPDRKLFWVRLRVKESGQTLLVSNAHYVWAGSPEEKKTGLSPRVAQAKLTVRLLDRLAGEAEPVLFMGDLNEAVHPRRILSEAGYVDSFSALGLPARPTRPARPIDNRPDEVDDWIFSNEQLRACGSLVPHFYYQETPPSDHWPVLAFYQLD